MPTRSPRRIHPLRRRPTLRTSLLALLVACAHSGAPSDDLARAAVQVAPMPRPSADLAEALPFPAPVAAAVYNSGQQAHGALVADHLARHVAPADLEGALDHGARAALGPGPAQPTATVQLSVDQWGVHATLPGEPGQLEVTVRARLQRPHAAPIRVRPVTCTADLATLAPDARSTLDALAAADLSDALATLSVDCASRAVAALAAAVTPESTPG